MKTGGSIVSEFVRVPPSEPTQAMIDAVDGFVITVPVCEDDTQDIEVDGDWCAEIYRNMVAAAPAASAEPVAYLVTGDPPMSFTKALIWAIPEEIEDFKKRDGQFVFTPLYAAPPQEPPK